MYSPPCTYISTAWYHYHKEALCVYLSVCVCVRACLYIHKRELHICKRAPQTNTCEHVCVCKDISKRALHAHTSSFADMYLLFVDTLHKHTHVYTSANNPYIFTKEPYISAKEPYMHTYTRMSANDPYMFSKEPYKPAKQLFIHTYTHMSTYPQTIRTHHS